MARYGNGKAIALARFVPVVRTVMNPLAGVLARTFAVWQVGSGLVWTIGVMLAGYELGLRISHVDHYLLPIVAVVVIVSLISLGLELWRHRRTAGDQT